MRRGKFKLICLKYSLSEKSVHSVLYSFPINNITQDPLALLHDNTVCAWCNMLDIDNDMPKERTCIDVYCTPVRNVDTTFSLPGYKWCTLYTGMGYLHNI